jgi:hypothetical protein
MVCFRWAWCAPIAAQPKRCQGAAYVQATRIVWNVLLMLVGVGGALDGSRHGPTCLAHGPLRFPAPLPLVCQPPIQPPSQPPAHQVLFNLANFLKAVGAKLLTR